MALSVATRYATALLDAYEEAAAKEQEAIIKRFLMTLEADHVMSLAPAIVQRLAKLVREREERRTARITMAHKLEHAPKSFSQFGEATITIAESLIGGVRVQKEGLLLDASAQGGLTHLRQALSS